VSPRSKRASLDTECELLLFKSGSAISDQASACAHSEGSLNIACLGADISKQLSNPTIVQCRGSCVDSTATTLQQARSLSFDQKQ
jgi:hypothetical protein